MSSESVPSVKQKNMKLLICVLSLCALAAAQDNFKECLDKDSISCVQMMVRILVRLEDCCRQIGKTNFETVGKNE